MNTTASHASPADESAAGASVAGSVLVLDGGDRGCVQLLLELRALIAQAEPGTVIHVRTTDPAAPLDLPAWCHLTGHTYLGQVHAATRPTYALKIADTAVATDPDQPWLPTPPGH